MHHGLPCQASRTDGNKEDDPNASLTSPLCTDWHHHSLVTEAIPAQVCSHQTFQEDAFKQLGIRAAVFIGGNYSTGLYCKTNSILFTSLSYYHRFQAMQQAQPFFYMFCLVTFFNFQSSPDISTCQRTGNHKESIPEYYHHT